MRNGGNLCINCLDTAFVRILEQSSTTRSMANDEEERFRAIAYDSKRNYLFILIGNQIRKYSESLTVLVSDQLLIIYYAFYRIPMSYRHLILCQWLSHMTGCLK